MDAIPGRGTADITMTGCKEAVPKSFESKENNFNGLVKLPLCRLDFSDDDYVYNFLNHAKINVL